MDTSREFQKVLDKQSQGLPVTMRDVAVVIANDPETLLRYMVDNDYVQVHKLLHLSDAPMLMGKNASFRPDKKRVAGELKSLLTRNNFKVLNQVTDFFVINTDTDNYTSNPELIQKLCDVGAVHKTPTGEYEFDIVFN